MAADSKQRGLKQTDTAGVYLPYSARITPRVFLARASADPLRLAAAIRARVAGVDGSIAVSRLLTLDQIRDRVAWRERFFAVLVACFTAIALALAEAGFYAMLSYVVSLERREIGIRMALGASPASVRRLVARQGLWLAGIGVIAGAAALGLTRLLKSQLFEVSPTDAAAWTVAVAVFLAVALLASVAPARKATRVDPAIALRAE